MLQPFESGSWKRLIFCGSGSTLMKEIESGSELGSNLFYLELEAKAKNSKGEEAETNSEAQKFKKKLDAEALKI